MEINDFLTAFKEQFVDAEDIVLDLDMSFREIDSYDSLTGMAILVMIKDSFGLDIDDESYKTMHSVHEVYNFIQKELK